MCSLRESSVMIALSFLSPRPAKRGEGGEQPSGSLRPSATGYGCEPGEGCFEARKTLSPPLRGDPLPQAGEGKKQRSSRRYSSVHVLLIALVAFERRDRGFGGFGRNGLHVDIGAHQCGAHVLRHLPGVTADVEVR